MILDDRSEWLEADGLGGFASGTVSGIRTRRYHALLLPATTPPTGRVVLVNGFEAWVETTNGSFPISTQRYAPDVVHPDGASRIASFSTEPWPTWEFDVPGNLRLRQEIFARQGAGATIVAWTVCRADAVVRLNVRPLLSGRDYHATHHENGAFRFAADVADASVAFRPYDGVPATIVLSTGTCHHAPEWYRNFLYREEAERGLDATEDLASPGVFHWDLAPGDRAVWILKAGTAGERESRSRSEVAALYEQAHAAESERRKEFPTPIDRAIDAYVVQRGTGRTIVAGYPWFTDWGRDTFIAIRGLCLATERLADARHILVQWAGAVSEGMLPNRFPDRGDVPEFNSVDASLWYVIAASELLTAAANARDAVTVDDHHAIEAAIRAIDLLDRGRARRVVDVVERRLVTPLGLRSLAAGEAGYAGHYTGDSSSRDAVYHQGTVSPWLLGPFVDAWVRVRGNTATAKQSARTRFLEPLAEHLRSAGLGHVSEIADGDAPFTPRGCPFQAWSLGEFVRLDRKVLARRRRSAPRRIEEPQWA